MALKLQTPLFGLVEIEPSTGTTPQVLEFPCLDFSRQPCAVLQIPADMEHDPSWDDMSDSTFDVDSRPSVHTSDDENHVDDTASEASWIDGRETEDSILSAAREEVIDDGQDSEPQASTSLTDTMVEEQLASPSLINSRIRLHPFTSNTGVVEEGTSSIRLRRSSTVVPDRNYEIKHEMIEDNPALNSFLTSDVTDTHPLRVSGPFHVLYNGDSEMKEDVLQKIAQALSSPGNPHVKQSNFSRFAVVQLSSFLGRDGNPEVDLVPRTNLELCVFDATLSTLIDHRRGQLSSLAFVPLDYSVGHRDHERDLGNSRIESTPKPNVAVMIHSLKDDYVICNNRSRQSRQLGEGGVPIIHLFADNLSYLAAARPLEIDTIDRPTSEVALTSGYLSSSTSTPLVQTDVQTFLALDAAQLNRYLANLVGTADSGDVSRPTLLSRVLAAVIAPISYYTELSAQNYQTLRNYIKTSRNMEFFDKAKTFFTSTRYQYGNITGAMLISLVFGLYLASIIMFGQQNIEHPPSVMTHASMQQTSTHDVTLPVSSIASRIPTSTGAAPFFAAVPTSANVVRTTDTPVANCKPNTKGCKQELNIIAHEAGSRVFIRSKNKIPKKSRAKHLERCIKVQQGNTTLQWTVNRWNDTTYLVEIELLSNCEEVFVHVSSLASCPKRHLIPNANCPSKKWFGPPLRNLIGYIPRGTIGGRSEELPVHIRTTSTAERAKALMEEQKEKAKVMASLLTSSSSAYLEDASAKLQKSYKAFHKSTVSLINQLQRTRVAAVDTRPNKVPRRFNSKLAGQIQQIRYNLQRYEDHVARHWHHQQSKITLQIAKEVGEAKVRINSIRQECDKSAKSLRSEIESWQAKASELFVKPRKVPRPVKIAKERAATIVQKAIDAGFAKVTGLDFAKLVKERRKKAGEDLKAPLHGGKLHDSKRVKKGRHAKVVKAKVRK